MASVLSSRSLHEAAEHAPHVLEVFMVVAALRWASVQDEEREVIAAFNEEPFEPSVPDALRWDQWREAPRPLTADEVATLWRSIRGALGQPGDPPVPRLVSSMARGSILEDAMRWADTLELDTPAGRHRASEAISGLVSDLMGRAYFGELITPAAVARLIVALANPHLGERIYDPCFGTGGLLLAAAAALWRQGQDVSPSEWARARQVPLFGVEIIPTLHLVGFTRLLLAGLRPALELGDALEREAAGRHHGQGFDCVIANPPWGRLVDDASLYDFPIRSRSSETLFLQHALRSLRPGGRAVVAVPPVLLWHGGPERELRALLLRTFRVEAVVTLPQGALESTSVQPTLLLVRRAPPAGSVTFAELDTLPETPAEARACVEAMVQTKQAPWIRELRSVPVAELLKADARLEIPTGFESVANDDLAALREHFELVPLGAVCEVIAGVPVGKEAVSTTPVGSPPIPLVRISSLGEGVLRDEGRYANDALRAAVRDEKYALQGDVLISVEGVIGKVLHVRGVLEPSGRMASPGTGTVLALPQRGLTILRPRSTLDPRFLTAIFESATYQGLLRRLASGTHSARLPLQALRDVLVPVPPPAVQARLLRRIADQPGDAIAALSLLATRQSDDPLAALLRDHPAFIRLLAEGMPEEVELRSSALEVLKALRPLRNQVAHAADVSVPLSVQSWLMVLGATPIVSLRSRGDDLRFETLTATQALVRSALSTLGDSTDLMVRQLRRLTERLIAWIDGERERAAGDFLLALTHDEDALESRPDGPVGARLRLSLEGSAYLDDVTLRAERLGVEISSPNLIAGQDLAFRVSLPADLEWAETETIRAYTAYVAWSATRMDGRRVTGQLDCAVEVRRDPLPVLDLLPYGASPYITGDVVMDPNRFVGRGDVLDDICTHVAGGTKVILLEGNRRTGKTSILRQLRHPSRGLTDTWILIESSFQGTVGDSKVEGIPTDRVFRMLVRDIGDGCAQSGIAVPLPGMAPVAAMNTFRFSFARALNEYMTGIEPFEALLIYVDQVVDAIAPRRLLLMLDEFDKLQVGIDNGVTSPQVPENIRNLLQTRASVSAIISGSRRLRRLREEYWSALFGFGHRIGIDPLTPAEIEELVQRPVARRLIFERAAIDEIVRLTACQPFLAQSLCARMFDLAKHNAWRRIGLHAVNEAVSRMVRDNEHFQALWDYAGVERRRYLLWLCHKASEGPYRVNAALLAQKLNDKGVRVSVATVDEDLRFLVELELVSFANTPVGSQYAVAIPLMQRWMEHNIDADALRRRAMSEASSSAESRSAPT